MKKKLPTIKSINQKALNLITPIIKLTDPECILCGSAAQVGHHFMHQSKSLRVRFELKNIISLCNGCHFKLHKNECYWAGKIIQIKGLKWFYELDKMIQEEVRGDIHWFIGEYERLHRLSTILTKI